MRFASLLPLTTLAATSAFSCGSGGNEENRPPPLTAGVGQGGAFSNPPGGTPSCIEPAEVDTSGACAAETAKLFERKPTIYFILDISGSMSEFVLDGEITKMAASRLALKTVTEELGHRIKYGLTTFPGPDDQGFDPSAPLLFGCNAGQEVFAITEGDPLKCLNLPPDGPVITSFQRTLRALQPQGKTPLGPTIASVTPKLAGSENSTSVILVTDGWPNCGTTTGCAIADCGPNLLGLSTDEVVCDEETNCCDPDEVGDIFSDPAANCVDGDASVSAVETLKAAGVDTYVVGVLGEFDFDSIMNRLAVAGGQPRDGSRKYHDVQNLDELTDTIRAIGSRIAQNCTIDLQDRPPQANEVNVYFDGELLPADPDNGWTLEDETITLTGDACDRVRGGDVQDVQILSGCVTIPR